MTENESSSASSKTQIVQSNPAPEYVSYEVFTQAMELNTENMRQLYSMLHEINMQKSFSMEVDMGGIKMIISGDSQKPDDVIKAANTLIDKFAERIFTKTDIVKYAKELQQKECDEKKGYS